MLCTRNVNYFVWFTVPIYTTSHFLVYGKGVLVRITDTKLNLKNFFFGTISSTGILRGQIIVMSSLRIAVLELLLD